MDDVLLHAVELSGMFVALAAPLVVLGLVVPSLQRLWDDIHAAAMAEGLARSAARWGARAAAIAGGAVLVELPSRVAEIEDTTLLGGVDGRLLARFTLGTLAGRLAVVEVVALLGAALAAARTRRDPLHAPAAWMATTGFAAVALVAHGIGGHAAAQPLGRGVAVTAELIHLLAASIWLGVLGHLFITRAALRRGVAPGARRLVAGMLARFSPLALASAGLLGVTGVVAAARYLHTPTAVLNSAYGLTLLTKLGLTLPLLAGGFVNFRLVRPALDRATDPTPALTRLGRMLELEVVSGVMVIAIAGALATMVSPGSDGAFVLTSGEVKALLTPTYPGTAVGDPMTWLDAPTRTLEDLRYAEFTHHWSGVAVCLLGLAWLVQQRGGRLGRRMGWVWPAILVPLAAFIAVASDPEFWPLGPVPLSVGLVNPAVLGHRVGAGLVVLLAVLGWRAWARRAPKQPLGEALPLILIVGSLLFLGHVHQGFASTDRLDTIIGVQHTIIAALGLFAGVVRWLELREVLPRRAAGILWPGLIVTLGVMMAFWYHEVI